MIASKNHDDRGNMRGIMRAAHPFSIVAAHGAGSAILQR
jgi:hypothetical protein